MRLKRCLIRLLATGLLGFIRWGILHNLWPRRGQQLELTSALLDLREILEANA